MKHVVHALLAAALVALCLETVLAAFFQLSTALGRYGPRAVGFLEQMSAPDGQALRREVAKCATFAAAGFVGALWFSIGGERRALVVALAAVVAIACGYAWTAPAMGLPKATFGPSLISGLFFSFAAAVAGVAALRLLGKWGIVEEA
ncbi:MAG: hypothetical protein NTV97_25510 [Alphaproteobacteria bacterium]|nr:hypothetical protein [Alphaproteobacteria bacterium]